MNCALYHANAGKMDALKARFRDYVDRPEELDRESLSQTDSLQSTPERRALRGLGATRAIHAGAARRIQIAAPITRNYPMSDKRVFLTKHSPEFWRVTFNY